MFGNDNWGARARIGMFIVGHEAVPEAEWWAMRPDGVSVHAARVTARAPWAAWRDDRSAVDLPEDMAHGAAQFAAMAPDAVVVGHSSSSVMGGPGWDAAVIAALGDILGPQVAVTTNGLDCSAALTALGARRPFLVLPPWYGDGTCAAAGDYLRDAGFDPAGQHRFTPGGTWAGIAPGDLVGRGLANAQETAPLFIQITEGCPADADAVLIAGTGFRCVGIIEALEAELGRPVVAANQASLWRCLRLAGIDDAVPGYGALLRC